jgi:cyclophilin family peptidyl-prolyl cis-trans isomerase
MIKKVFLLGFLVASVACSSAKYKGLQDGLYAEINTNKGDIFLELYYKDVPMTVANFVSLSEGTNTKVTEYLKGKPYYDGVTFHRVIDNFMIQTGDPTGTGTGNPGYSFEDEFPKDKDGLLMYSHNDAGILSMANAGKATNGSQFFITHKPTYHLDNKHTVFGKTTINSIQEKELKRNFVDSISFNNAKDSLRMLVVNQIKKNDTINTIEIIRIGKEAKKFKNAGEIFIEELEKVKVANEEREANEKEIEKARYSKYLEEKEDFSVKMNEEKAFKTSSGLKVLKLKETNGSKVVAYKPITLDFALYIADGKEIQSTFNNDNTLTCRLDDTNRPMISGFKEGLLQLKEGERARLFIPYYIGYGEEKFGPFPPKADLIFEVEILKVGQ